MSEHYSRPYSGTTAAAYDAQVFYDINSPLVQWQLAHVMDRLDLRPGHRLVDIGGGTGGFTHQLACRLALAGDLKPSVMLVEPSTEMIAQAVRRPAPALSVVHEDVNTFVQKNIEFDRVLIKEVVHHFPESERGNVFSKLFDMLSPGGKVLVISRPAKLKTEHLPFPEDFLKAIEQQLPSQQSCEEQIRAAGFEVHSESSKSFPLRIPRPVWYRMLRERFWSFLAYFSDEEIEAAVEEIELMNAGTDDFECVELINFIVGTKITCP